MASFSDDEQYSGVFWRVDSILQQRKRKGILEYLVKWKEGDSDTWEPADKFKADCPLAVSIFEKLVKTKSKKRSSSRSRKSSQSRSRSRSSSRTRKPREATARSKTTRTQSRGKSSESQGRKETAKAAGDSVDTTRKAAEASSSEIKKQQEVEKKEEAMAEKNVEVSQSSRVLRSSTVAASTKSREELEVQRVHNEQRPVREDDKEPRSAIWKVADYFVIVLFVISALAALVMFVEKFVDLENFKKQAFPNVTVLQGRLVHAKDRLLDMAQFSADRLTDLYLQLVDQFKGPQATPPASSGPKQ